ncbi:MAG: hypothetical protein JXX28_08550 [Deltaproteobacteria bacterium]|nr:hypothetical protein [Deltaproteobacteria bacterium]
MKPSAPLVDLDLRLKRADGLRRAKELAQRPDRDEEPPVDGRAPGAALVRTATGWTLEDAPLSIGDPIEVYTNRSNGWVRGRFEWGGLPDDPGMIAVNVWDPAGARDEDGLPPWVGSLEAALPPRARVRRG